MAIIILPLVIFSIYCFFRMPRTNKLFLLICIGFFLHEIRQNNLGLIDIDSNPLYLFKLFSAVVAIFVLLATLSFAETKSDKKSVLMFFLKFGGIYVAMITVMKLIVFASTGFNPESWKHADLLISIMPYKWVFFIIILLIMGKRKRRR